METVVMHLLAGVALVVGDPAEPFVLGAPALLGLVTEGQTADTEVVVDHELGLLLQVPLVHEGAAVRET